MAPRAGFVNGWGRLTRQNHGKSMDGKRLIGLARPAGHPCTGG